MGKEGGGPLNISAYCSNRISRPLFRITANKPTDQIIKILNLKEGRKKGNGEERKRKLTAK